MAWEKLGSTTLGSSADTITVDSLEAKKHLMVQVKTSGSGSSSGYLRFNNDSGSNYAWRLSDNGGADATGPSDTQLYAYIGTSATEKFSTYYIINEQTKEKLVTGVVMDHNSSGAGNAPNRRELTGKWANTTNQITRVDVINHASGDFTEGSEVTVYGTD